MTKNSNCQVLQKLVGCRPLIPNSGDVSPGGHALYSPTDTTPLIMPPQPAVPVLGGAPDLTANTCTKQGHQPPF